MILTNIEFKKYWTIAYTFQLQLFLNELAFANSKIFFMKQFCLPHPPPILLVFVWIGNKVQQVQYCYPYNSLCAKLVNQELDWNKVPNANTKFLNKSGALCLNHKNNADNDEHLFSGSLELWHVLHRSFSHEWFSVKTLNSWAHMLLWLACFMPCQT